MDSRSDSFGACGRPLGVALLLLVLSPACRVVQTAVDAPGQTLRAVTPGKKDGPAADPVEVQQTLLRFADEFSTRLILGLENLRRGTNAVDPVEVLQWRIAVGTKTCSIVSGSNPFANLLDLTVFVTVTRAALEEHWQPHVFGDSALPMLEACREAETNVWRFAGQILKPEQQAELRGAIDEWRRLNPLPESVLAARAVGFASQMAKTKRADTAKPGSVFNLLNLDPLAGLDPATREIAQTRLFAERALYVTQTMPLLLRWHTELLMANATELPAVRQLVRNSTELTAAVERFAHVAEQLPQSLSAEREQILEALEAQEKALTPLVLEVRQALAAGSQMSASLNTTLTTFDALMQRFGVGEAGSLGPPSTNAEPFRIRDYGQTATQLEAAARQLTELLHALDQTLGSTNLTRLSGQLGPAVQQAQTGGKEIVDYAFWKGVLLLGIALVTALIYRLLVTRLTGTRSG